VRTLRGRLFAILAVAVLVSTLLTVVVAGILTRRYVERQILSDMGRRLDVLMPLLDDLGTPLARSRLERSFRLQGEFLALPGAPPGTLSARVREAVLASGETSGKIDGPAGDVLVVVRDSPDGPVVLARKAGLGEDDWRPFAGSLVLAAVGGAAVAGLLSFFLARRLSRPIRAVAEASSRLASGEPEVRVQVEGEDELAALASSFNRMADQLQAARDAERTFLMSVSHELKTPLTAIRGYAEAVRDGAATPAEAGEVIGREAERLERLVRDLLDLARLDRRQFSVARERVDLAEVAREAERRYAPRAREFTVELSTEVDGPSWATGDRDRLLQAVSNLVENALRSTPAGGKVAVRARDGGLEVADTGPGLAPEDLPRAFDRFWLHQRYGAERPVGSGLGLAIVKELVEAMDGTVSVKSRLGEGTTFRIQLPATGPPGS
jgi:two-component system sensor histidine kinase BaeS